MSDRPEVSLVDSSGTRRHLDFDRVVVCLSGVQCHLDFGMVSCGLVLGVLHGRELAAIPQGCNLFRFRVLGDIAADQLTLHGLRDDKSLEELAGGEIHVEYGRLGMLELTLQSPEAGVWEMTVHKPAGVPGTGRIRLAFGATNLVTVLLQQTKESTGAE